MQLNELVNLTKAAAVGAQQLSSQLPSEQMVELWRCIAVAEAEVAQAAQEAQEAAE